MHHGGVFHSGMYVGGRLNYIDECDTTRFNLFELSSIMVALGYKRNYICEWYYCDPEKNHELVGLKHGEPKHPLYDEKHMDRFLSLLGGKWKEIHVYSVEISHVEAVVKLKADEITILEKFERLPNSGVVIEEIEEAPKPKPNPKRRPMYEAELKMLCWYEPDPEFEEYLRNSLEEDKRLRRSLEHDGLLGENLIGRLNEVAGVSDHRADVGGDIVEAVGATKDDGVAIECSVQAENVVHADESVHAFVMGQPVVLEEVINVGVLIELNHTWVCIMILILLTFVSFILLGWH